VDDGLDLWLVTALCSHCRLVRPKLWKLTSQGQGIQIPSNSTRHNFMGQWLQPMGLLQLRR
jgi:hypothetical protein